MIYSSLSSQESPRMRGRRKLNAITTLTSWNSWSWIFGSRRVLSVILIVVPSATRRNSSWKVWTRCRFESIEDDKRLAIAVGTMKARILLRLISTRIHSNLPEDWCTLFIFSFRCCWCRPLELLMPFLTFPAFFLPGASSRGSSYWNVSLDSTNILGCPA